MFLSLFALDVFSEGYGFGRTVLALLIHLVPVYIVVIVLVIAWRWEWVGAILFIVLSLLYLAFNRGGLHWGVFLAIPGPPFIIGISFLLNWIFKNRSQTQ
jgi:hypothetical protein